MKRLLFLAMINFFGFSYLTAQRVAAQSESNVIDDTEMEVHFIVPDGWQANKKDIGYVMGSATTQGFMLLRTDEFSSLKSLKQAMNAGIEQEDGSKLTPETELNMLGKLGVSGLYKGTIDGTEMSGFLMAILPDGKGKAIICLSVAPKSVFNQSNMDQLKILMRSAVRIEKE